MEKILEALCKHPEMAEMVLSGVVEQYKPLIYAVGNEILKIYQDYANNKKLAMAKATVRKNQYDAYMQVGFTEAEAMSLLLTDIRKVAEFVEKSSNRINRTQSKQ